jgi:anti-sigma factor RsiW
MNCREVREALHLYLDGELEAASVLQMESHLVDCADCRKEYETLLSAVESVRGAHRLFDAPTASRQKIEKLIQGYKRRVTWMRGAMAASVLVVLLGLAWFIQRGMVPKDRFAALAAESHLRYARGTLPLDVKADDPQQVATWLSNKLPFHLVLPNYPEKPGRSKRYTLEGARLLPFGEDDVAYLAYRMEGRPISLLMTSSTRVVPTGGSLYRSGGLEFHTTSYKGLRLITWADKGLTYALVSDLEAVGAESCMICHGEENEHHKFEQFRPQI